MIIFNRDIISNPRKLMSQLNIATEEVFPESDIKFTMDSVYSPQLLVEQLNMLGAEKGQYFDIENVQNLEKLMEKLNLLFAI